MKRWIIGLAILILLSSLGCEAQDNKGLFYLGNLSCEQTVVPTVESAYTAKYAGDGVFDLEVAKYIGVNAGYFINPWLANKRVSSQKDSISRGEGNTIRIKGFEIKYEALGLEIEKLFIPQNLALEPESSFIPSINILPYELRNQILEYWAENAYADVDNARSYFHINAQGGTADCTNYTAEEDCHGYACVTDSESLDAAGKCMPMCTLESGCAMNCSEMVVDEQTVQACYYPHVRPSQWCDTGAGDIGYCRPTCMDTGYCPPVTLPDGTVALEYDCLDGYCYPKGTQVNPHKGENLIIRVKALAESSNGDDFTSNTVTFNVRVCRGCLLSFNGNYCNFSTAQIIDSLSEANYDCDTAYWGQDINVDCSMISGCRKFFCDEFQN